MRSFSVLSFFLPFLLISCKKDNNVQNNPTPVAPSVTTTAISGITFTSAKGGGNITGDGGAAITSRGLVWSTTPNPTVDSATKTNDGTGTGSFTSSITGLKPGTKYYVRAYATNSAGTGYGNEVIFTTAIDPRDKFVGTWEGIYKINFPNLPQDLPLNIPEEIMMTLVITKSDTSASEIIIEFQGDGMQNQQGTAVVTNNEYKYNPVSLTDNGITLKLNGTGKISNDGKKITESGTQTGSATIPGFPPLDLDGDWSSTLNKQ